MHYSTYVVALALATALRVTTAAPTNTIQERATSQCGQWDSITTDGYILYQDLWNIAAGTGSQCSTLNAVSGSTIGWSTSWSWAGGSNQVKSYVNAVVQLTSVPLSQIGSIPTTWSYSYTGSNIVADVSYDMFLGISASASASYEIMVWLAALGGAGPISSTGSPIATPTIGGISFKLFKGPNGSTTVFSFVASSEVTNFDGDLMNFFSYLISSQGVSSSQYLQSIGAGTEPFTGSNAVLTVTGYSAHVVLGVAKVQSIASTSTKVLVASPTSVKSSTTSSVSAKSSTTKATTTTTAPVATSTARALGSAWAQCGGVGFLGPTKCVAGYKCVETNEWYSQCLSA